MFRSSRLRRVRSKLAQAKAEKDVLAGISDRADLTVGLVQRLARAAADVAKYGLKLEELEADDAPEA